MNTILEVNSAINTAYRPNNLSITDEGSNLKIYCDNTLTTISNWRTKPLSEIVSIVGGKTLNEGYNGELLLG
jgi:hypothetical protein